MKSTQTVFPNKKMKEENREKKELEQIERVKNQFNSEKIFAAEDLIKEFTKCKELEFIDFDNTRASKRRDIYYTRSGLSRISCIGQERIELIKNFIFSNQDKEEIKEEVAKEKIEIALVKYENHYFTLIKKGNNIVSLDSSFMLGKYAESDKFKHPLLDVVRLNNNITIFVNNVKIQHDNISCLAFSIMFVKEIIKNQSIIDIIVDNARNQDFTECKIRKINSLPQEFLQYAQSVQLLTRERSNSRNKLVSSPSKSSNEEMKFQNISIDWFKKEILEAKEERDSKKIDVAPLPTKRNNCLFHTNS